MMSYYLTMIGLLLDIIGAFFVSVEAIKVKNLKTLREKILGPMHKATLSPKLKFVDGLMVTHASHRYVSIFMSLHYLAGALVIVGLNRLLDNKLFEWYIIAVAWTWSKPWYIFIALVAAFVFFGGFMGLWLIGELVHMAITKVTKLIVIFFVFIEDKTPDGTVGIIGFFFLFIGFVLQLWGTSIAGYK